MTSCNSKVSANGTDLAEQLYTQIQSFQRSSQAARQQKPLLDAKSRNQDEPRPFLTQASTNPYLNLTESKTKTKDSETASSRGPTEQQSLRYDQRPVSERLITMG